MTAAIRVFGEVGARRRATRPLGVMAASFVLLGAPMAAVAVAWPSMAGDLGLLLASLGVLSLAFGGGYTVSTLVAGVWGRRAGTEVRLATSAVIACVSLVGIATAPAWVVVVGAALVLGLAGGQVDAAVNTHVSLRGRVSSMGLIHAAYGLGVALAPVLVVVLVAGGVSSRAAVGVLAVAEAAVAGGFLAAVRWARTERPAVPLLSEPLLVPATGRRALALSVVTFMLYGGIAAGTGTWAYTVISEHGAVSGTLAGIAVAGYWGRLTVSRLLLGTIERRIALEWLPQVTVLVACPASCCSGWARFRRCG